MAIAGIYNITMDQGAQWTLTVDYDNNNGTPFNLTGYTARMQVRPKFGADTAVLTLSSVTGGIVITPLTGTLALTATTAQTGAIDGGFYVYDLLVRQDHRGQGFGKQLIDHVRLFYEPVYVMSDVDRYYEKIGMSKIGSIFE
jgi:hypothetical protein